jgi:hypothetical protein
MLVLSLQTPHDGTGEIDYIHVLQFALESHNVCLDELEPIVVQFVEYSRRQRYSGDLHYAL